MIQIGDVHAPVRGVPALSDFDSVDDDPVRCLDAEASKAMVAHITAQRPIGFALGCGITAFSEDDACALVSSALQQALPSVASIEVDVDVSTLDANHVLPNMGDCSQRGIWYPRLGELPFVP